jgi:prepilin-type N-terminal cleavage/methylation domain-containing protein
MLERLKARRESGEGGFTLIELLLVIVILGILAAVVVFSVRGIADRGSGASCNATVSATKTAAEAFYAKNGRYPATFNDINGVNDTATVIDKFMDTSAVVLNGAFTAVAPKAAPSATSDWVVTLGALGAVTATHVNAAGTAQIATPTPCG